MPPTRIAGLTVRHFKSVNGTLDVPLGGRNLVVLGENGSGKTSLTRALSAVLEASRRTTDDTRAALFERCIDASTPDDAGFVRLELTDGSAFCLHEDGTWQLTPPTPVRGMVPPPISLSEAAKAKRVLDYKALLRTYFLQGVPVDLFDLLLEDVLANEEYTVGGLNYAEGWAELGRLHAYKPRNSGATERLEEAIQRLNAALGARITAIETEAQLMLADFDSRLSFKLTFGPVIKTERVEPVGRGYVYLQVLRDGQPIDRHTDFLNEARLSAIALCLHFAVLKAVPPTALRVLVLDDVLIGLDIDNREPILKLIQAHFASWQTVMLTYDRVWFAKMRRWLDERAWNCWELRRHGDRLDNTRLLNKRKGILGDAERLFGHGEYASAANTARSALESVFKRHFEDNEVLMPYRSEGRHHGLEDFFEKAWKLEDAPGARKISKEMERRLKASQELFNSLSHEQNYEAGPGDVRAALDSVKDVAELLNVPNP